MTSTDSPPVRPQAEDPAPLRAVHTTNFPALLLRLGASLLVTTYQAGKLVMVRDEGDHLNTHFRSFKAPMDLVLDGGWLAVGTTIQVWEFVDEAMLENSFVVPDSALADAPAALRAPTAPRPPRGEGRRQTDRAARADVRG